MSFVLYFSLLHCFNVRGLKISFQEQTGVFFGARGFETLKLMTLFLCLLSSHVVILCFFFLNTKHVRAVAIGLFFLHTA